MRRLKYLAINNGKSILMALLLAFVMGNLIGIIADADEISKEFVRFHIVANSNSEKDQEIKWKVREAIFHEMDLSSIHSKESAIDFFRLQKDRLEAIANQVLSEHDFSYQCCVSVGKKWFPVREYSDFVLPAGVYDAVSVTLGQGKGENFFCVMYPSLCMIEGVTEQTASNREVMNCVLSEEEISTITGNKKKLVIQFKIVEIIQEILS